MAPNLSTLDDLERPKRPLAEVNKNSGAHQKNFNEDRPISLVGKCRPMHLFAINIKCMRICIGVPSEKVYLPPIPIQVSSAYLNIWFPGEIGTVKVCCSNNVGCRTQTRTLYDA